MRMRTVPAVNPAGVIKDLSVSPDAVTPTINPAAVIKELTLSPDATLPEVTLDAKLNLPDVASLPPLDLSPLISTLNIPITFTPDVTGIERAINDALGTPDGDEGGAQEGFTDEGGTTTRTSERLQQIRDRATGQGVRTVPAGGEGNSGGFLNALDSLKDSINSGIESGLSALPDSIEGLTRAILGTGVAVGGDGVSLGADRGGLTDAQVESLAASLGEDLDSSFRSDFIPTLLGNQPGHRPTGEPRSRRRYNRTSPCCAEI